MADETTPKPPVVVEQVPSVVGSLSALASAQAPFIYFDSAPNYGFNSGIANLSLEAVRFTPSPNGQGVLADRVTVAHLRMSLEAVKALRMALDGIELMATPAQGGKN